MRAHLKYLKYVLRHKWHVFRAACRLGIPWPGLIHDLSKFRPSEWGPYVEYFYGKKHPSIMDLHGDERNQALANGRYKEQVEQDFGLAWNHHQKRNKHHWQYWVLHEDAPKSRWTTQAYCPEIGPYWLAYDNVRIAKFGMDGSDGCSDGEFQAMRRVEKALKDSEAKVLPMPDKYRREMLADWMGAGMAVGKPDTRAWYLAQRERDRQMLHPETRRWIETQLGVKA